jgi:hypothetical protein
LTDTPHPSSLSGDSTLQDHGLPVDATPERSVQTGSLAPSAWLSVLGDGSRLELAQRCRERWRARAYLVDPGHLEARSLARLAFELAARPGTSPGELCRLAIDLAVDDLVRLQGSRAWVGGASEEPSEVERHLVDELGVDPRLAPARLCAFNACDEAARAAYFDCCIEGASLDEHAARSGAGLDEARDALRRALRAILGDVEGGSDG